MPPFTFAAHIVFKGTVQLLVKHFILNFALTEATAFMILQLIIS